MTGQQKNIDQLQWNILLLSQKKSHKTDPRAGLTESSLRRKIHLKAALTHWSREWWNNTNYLQFPFKWLNSCCAPVLVVCSCKCVSVCVHGCHRMKPLNTECDACVCLSLSVSAYRPSVNVWKQKVEKIKPNWPENSSDTFSLSNTHAALSTCVRFLVFVCAEEVQF